MNAGRELHEEACVLQAQITHAQATVILSLQTSVHAILHCAPVTMVIFSEEGTTPFLEGGVRALSKL